MKHFIFYFVIPTILFLPFYLFMRQLFIALPLHRDTGYYVSSDTVHSKKWCYAKGWNATFAMCSKVLPEFFYSLIYLRYGGLKYKRYSRIYFSLFNFASSIMVGICGYVISGYHPAFYGIGLFIFGVAFSHPFTGTYFESGEQFEVPFQVIGFLLISLGLEKSNTVWLCAGITLWLMESFLIKTASLITVAILEVLIFFLRPDSFGPLLATNLFCFSLYLFWIKLNGQELGRTA